MVYDAVAAEVVQAGTLESLGRAPLYAVADGCAITWSSTSLNITVAAGHIFHNGKPLAVAEQTVAVTVPSGGKRWVGFGYDANGTLGIVIGAEAADTTSAPALKPDMGNRVTIGMALYESTDNSADDPQARNFALDKRVFTHWMGKKGANVASAATLLMPDAGGDYFHVTGNIAITALFAGLPDGAAVTLAFDAAITLTHSANLILAEGANHATVVGEVIQFRHEGANVWRETARHGGTAAAQPTERVAILGSSYTPGTAWATMLSVVIPVTTGQRVAGKIGLRISIDSTSTSDYIEYRLLRGAGEILPTARITGALETQSGFDVLFEWFDASPVGNPTYSLQARRDADTGETFEQGSYLYTRTF